MERVAFAHPRQRAARGGLVQCLMAFFAVALLASAALATQDPAPPAPPDFAALVAADDFQEAPGGKMVDYGPTPPRPATVVATTARQPQGSLSGRIVFTSAGHGFDWDGDEWITDRGDNNEIVEDLGNIDQMTLYAQYCFNAGATVVPFRPVGFQPNEIILDNDDAGVTWTGTWGNSSSTLFYGTAGDTPYRYAATNATETATATYRPNITVAGFYPVYCWARWGSDRVDDQLYRIVHSGGTNEVRINHRAVGHGWIYLGTYYFTTGTSGYVVISNQSADTVPGSPVVIADAIRFGNGMGEVDYGSGVSGLPKEDECSRLWVRQMAGQGASSTLWDNNVTAPPRMAAWMNRESEGAATKRVYLGFHSNAGGGRGVVGLYNNDTLFPGTKTVNQQAWALLVADELNDDLVAIGSPPLPTAWYERGTNLTYARSDYAFGEINNLNINDEFDATIVEVAFHDSASDALLLRDQKARNWCARACLQATIRYFNTYDGAPSTLPPDPPTNPRAISNGDGTVTVTWTAPATGGVGGDAPTGYVVYRSSNGYGFGNPVTVPGGATVSTTISVTPDQVTYFRVAAANAGGESMPSETIAARPKASGASPILIVNGFQRLDRSMNVRQTTNLGSTWGGVQTFDRVKLRESNSYDYVVQHAQALAAAGRHFDSCSNAAVENAAIALAPYKAVVWILGEESSGDATFSSTEQSRVTNYLNGGGNLFVSGAEIGWDLDRNNYGRSFYNNTLKSNYDESSDADDDAGTYQAQGAEGGIFAAVGSFDFDPANGAPYNADYPDRVWPVAPAVTCLNYVGGIGGPAAIQADTGTYKVIVIGFPFELITSPAIREQIMQAAMDWLDPPSDVADWTLF